MADMISSLDMYLTFEMNGALYGLDIEAVREILDMADITRIPQAPDFMRGVVNVRGSAIPVVDLRKRLGLGDTERSVHARIIILEVPVKNEPTLIGALADSVREVLELSSSGITPPPKMGASIDTSFIKGVARHGERFIIILDIATVFSLEELSARLEPPSRTPIAMETPPSGGLHAAAPENKGALRCSRE